MEVNWKKYHIRQLGVSTVVSLLTLYLCFLPCLDVRMSKKNNSFINQLYWFIEFFSVRVQR